MRAVKGYAEATATNFNASQRLPAGGYVLKIIGVREENYSWGDVIVLAFDIDEGEYKGFFRSQFDNMPAEYRKWKGTYRLNVPKLNGTTENDKDKYKRSLSYYKAQIQAFEQSNGISINCSEEWDTEVLRGKLVGAVFGNKEWEMDGKTGWFTNCDHLVSVSDIREGRFKVPADKPLKNRETQKPDDSAELSEFEEILSDGDLPF